MFVYPVGFLGAKKNGPLIISSAAGLYGSNSQNVSFPANLGAAGGDIFVAVVCSNANSSFAYRPPSSVAVGGLGLTKVYQNSAAFADIWFGAGPSAGGSQTIAIAYPSAPVSVSPAWAFQAFLVRGSLGPSFTSGAGGAAASMSLATAAGGAIAAFAMGSGASCAWAGATKTNDITDGTSFKSAAYYNAASAEAGHAVSTSGSWIIGAAFKP